MGKISLLGWLRLNFGERFDVQICFLRILAQMFQTSILLEGSLATTWDGWAFDVLQNSDCNLVAFASKLINR